MNNATNFDEDSEEFEECGMFQEICVAFEKVIVKWIFYLINNVGDKF